MNSKQVTLRQHRLPGEIAFDRCFLPLVALGVLNAVFDGVERMYHRAKPETKAQLDAEMLPPKWRAWIWFALGLILAILWFRAVVTLVRAWQDPSSKVIRISGLVLLVPFAVTTCLLLLRPFQ